MLNLLKQTINIILLLGAVVAGIAQIRIWNGSGAEIVRISEQGRLGLATTQPNAQLDVNGNARISSLSSSPQRMVTVETNGLLSVETIPVDTDQQTLSINGQNLSISNGNTVVLPTAPTGARAFFPLRRYLGQLYAINKKQGTFNVLTWLQEKIPGFNFPDNTQHLMLRINAHVRKLTYDNPILNVWIDRSGSFTDDTRVLYIDAGHQVYDSDCWENSQTATVVLESAANYEFQYSVESDNVDNTMGHNFFLRMDVYLEGYFVAY